MGPSFENSAWLAARGLGISWLWWLPGIHFAFPCPPPLPCFGASWGIVFAPMGLRAAGWGPICWKADWGDGGPAADPLPRSFHIHRGGRCEIPNFGNRPRAKNSDFISRRPESF